ncbi:MAG TPA: N-ethylammeline chlorohydrolase, partial [Archaeoglobaceae archaeon]|nr:N-ethylammeline chlorohydrolase [Archaeoglobaceae archaeon]
MYDIAITDGLCFIDRGFIQANIGIEGNKIAYVGRKEIKGEVEINAYDKLVLPGLFNAHTHVAMTLLRGYAEDLPLNEWLKKIWDAERKLTTKDIYWGSMLGILEMIKTGTTAFCDHYFLMDGVAEAVKESGIRAVLCYGMMDRGDREKGERLLKESRKFIEKWDGESGIIRTILGPHSIYMCSPEFLIKVKE